MVSGVARAFSIALHAAKFWFLKSIRETSTFKTGNSWWFLVSPEQEFYKTYKTTSTITFLCSSKTGMKMHCLHEWKYIFTSWNRKPENITGIDKKQSCIVTGFCLPILNFASLVYTYSYSLPEVQLSMYSCLTMSDMPYIISQQAVVHCILALLLNFWKDLAVLPVSIIMFILCREHLSNVWSMCPSLHNFV